MNAPRTAPRRGFSLVEVLAALSLLSLLVASVIPLLRDAGTRAATDDRERIYALGRVADCCVEKASELALAELAPGATKEVTTAPAARVLIERRPLKGDAGVDGDWLVFRIGEDEVCRLVPYVPPQDDGT